MFNETSYFSDAGACPPGQVNDYDPATGQFSSLCVDDTEAYRAPVGSPGGATGIVNVSPKVADSWTNYALYGGIAVVALLVLGGRRR